MAMDSKRKQRVWYQQPISLHWWYWISSRYGESWRHALVVLAVIVLIFAGIYLFTDFQICPVLKMTPETPCDAPRALTLSEAFRQSLAIATFQSVEMRKPLTGWGEFVIILEKIIAPVQAALFALAIRRNFMR
jgi:hypothetical protein